MPWLLLLSACVTGLLPEEGEDTDRGADDDTDVAETDTVRDTSTPDLEIPPWTDALATQPMITEVCALGAGSFVEIANPTQKRLRLDGYTLARRYGFDRLVNGQLDLDDVTLDPGEVLVIGTTQDEAAWRDTWGRRADRYDRVVGGEGFDSYGLYTDFGDPTKEKAVDLYGALGSTGSRQPWVYTDTCARRNGDVWKASPSWQSDQWVVNTEGGPGER